MIDGELYATIKIEESTWSVGWSAISLADSLCSPCLLDGQNVLVHLEKLNKLPADRPVLLKLTLPEQDDFYSDCVRHPNVVRVLALSGGYTREESNERLRRNPGVVASFSRALLEGLRAEQSDAEFDAQLNAAIQSIFEASTVKRGSRKQTRRVRLRATV